MQRQRVIGRATTGSASGSRRPDQQVAPDLGYLRTLIANVYFVGAPGTASGEWVLVDAGLPGSAGRIVRAAQERFGRGSRPRAIVLTHGHFDHVGALRELAERWQVSIYAHRLELPFLTGRSAYPPPDPSVGGGLMARLAPLYPRGPVDVSEQIEPLPSDGSVPPLPGWRWIHTPGHTAGHVSLFRDADRVLLAGDAFITVNQESALDVMRQRPEVSGPPAYYTTDWRQAWESVRRLAALNPSLAATGHGLPMRGERLSRGLADLARDFGRLAIPRHGRYLRRPALTDEFGVVSVPPPDRPALPYLWLGVGLVALAAGLTATLAAARDRRRQFR